MKPNPIVVTACDSGYLPLALGLVKSIRDKPEIASLPIGFMDLGLTPEETSQLRALDVEVRTVGWDVDFPGRQEWEEQMPGYKAMISRSFLRDHFPGHTEYLWLDADAWVQRSEAVINILAAARNSTLQIASEFDRQYPSYFKGPAVWQVFHNWYAAAFGDDIATRMNLRPMLNCGVFALSGAAPHWDAWREIHVAGLSRNAGVSPATFMLEQLALNVAVYLRQLNVNLLPAGYNWLCHHAMPVWDSERKKFLESSIPHFPIAIMHLSLQDKQGMHQVPLNGSSDQTTMSLEYRPSH